jgi:hypothetical protein
MVDILKTMLRMDIKYFSIFIVNLYWMPNKLNIFEIQ